MKSSETEVKEKKEEERTNEKEKRKERHKLEKEKKGHKLLISIGVVLIIAIIFSVIFAIININNTNIITGVTIEGIEVSGISKEEAKEKLETIYNDKLQKQILLKYGEYESEINPVTIEAKYKIEEAVEEAYNIGRNSNIIVNNYSILYTLIRKKNVNVELEFNEEIAKTSLNDIASQLPGAIVQSSYYQEDDDNTLVITKGKAGVAIDIDKILSQIKDLLDNVDENNNFIEIPIINKEPDAIDIDKIHSEVYKEAKDAYYTKEPFAVYPEVYGVDFNIDEAKELVKEDKEEYVIKLTITKPKVTVDQFGEEAFPERLSIFTTKYNAGDVGRTTNLRIACQKINGKVLLAGETFSYNATLGERTVAAGYKDAKIFSAGEVVDGIGGGICQISSTLYNAAVMANLEIVERRNHQFVTSYLPAGRDATVVYGLTDFKFKNSRNYPIKINASIQGGIATVSIFGMKEDNEYDITFETRTIGSIPFTTKYVEDENVEEGKETVKQNGANGIQTETYKIMSQNGSVVSRSLLSKDTYTPMQKIIIKGIKKAEETSIVETPAEVVTENVVETQEKTEIQQPTQQEKQSATVVESTTEETE